MVARVAVLVAALGGCNWVLGLEAPRGTDAAIDGAVVDAVELDAPLGPWGARQVIPGLDRPLDGEEDPFLDVTGTELYSTVRANMTATATDVRVSQRDGSVWLTPQLVTEVNTGVDDATPRLSFDGLTLYVSSPRAGGAGMTDVWMASRVAPGAPWLDAAPLVDPAVNGPASDRTLTECAGGRFVFASERGGTSDLYEAAGGVATPIAIGAAPIVREVSPFVSRDCLTLYFASDRMGTFDLYVASRATPDAAFDAAILIVGLSQDDTHETDPWVSDDGRHVVFTAAPMAAMAASDIYEAFR